MGKHAFLAASASERWLHCPPSAMLCAQEDDQGSPYAQEGSDAHALCEHLLLTALGRPSRDPVEDLTWYNTEMQEAAEGYASFVMEQVAEARTKCPDPLVCVEQTVDFSKWVQHGFGTADALIIADDTLYITDFKYGVGCLVSAGGEDGTGNSQLKCYALGALDTFGMLALNSGVPLANFIPDPRPPGRRRAVLLCLQLSRSAKTAIFEKRIPVIADFPDPPAICFRAAYIQVSRANSSTETKNKKPKGQKERN